MISVSAHWLDPQHKPTLLAIPEIAPLIGRIEAVHVNLVAARDGDTSASALRALGEEAEDLDARHDHLSRALFYSMLAAQHYELGKPVPNEAAAEAIESGRDALFPQRLNIVSASYQAEAGNAAQIAKLAEGELAPLLEVIHVDKGTSAKDLALQLGETGQKLGAVENQKPQAAAEAQKVAIAPAEVRKRMRAWATVAETLLANLEQSTAPAAVVDAVRAPLLAAAEKATARRRAKRAAKAKQGAGTPED
ncbi:hypothetical protein [Polyangium fumosum]|uniref:Uncharacterized protein n=1 Tax=Polyangium fumosum TaxID=889272 RepID=A0A4U1JHR4_9BACT|nr:hypothetical protein [Polyangium fumosum]TKD10028.1 hypothetical protein E8A74_10530 [Polyangium fumosum]